MRSLGICAHCGKPIAQGKKTCGATMGVCTICKLPIHPHCLGEHRLMHRNHERLTQSIKETNNNLISRILFFIRTRIHYLRKESSTES